MREGVVPAGTRDGREGIIESDDATGKGGEGYPESCAEDGAAGYAAGKGMPEEAGVVTCPIAGGRRVRFVYANCLFAGSPGCYPGLSSCRRTSFAGKSER